MNSSIVFHSSIYCEEKGLSALVSSDYYATIFKCLLELFLLNGSASSQQNKPLELNFRLLLKHMIYFPCNNSITVQISKFSRMFEITVITSNGWRRLLQLYGMQHTPIK